MKSICCTNARDEDNILEWVCHHLNLGFNHIYIYDHLSILPIKNVLKNIPENLVTVCEIDTINGKSSLVKKCHEYAIQNNYDWLIYLDADEFIVLKQDECIDIFLEKYNDYEQVLLNWYIFGSNYIDNFKGGTIIENYTRSSSNLQNRYKSFICIKNILQNNNKVYGYNVHIRTLRDMSKTVTSTIKDSKLLMNIQEIKENINDVPAYIAHYILQAYDVYLKRKISIPMDHNGAHRKQIPLRNFHKHHNDIENKEVVNKYNEKNKIMIEKYINNKI